MRTALAFFSISLFACSTTNPTDDGGTDGSMMDSGAHDMFVPDNKTDAGMDAAMEASDSGDDSMNMSDGSDGGGCNNNACSNAMTLTSGMMVMCSTQGFMSLYDFGTGTSNACNAAFGGNNYAGPNATFKIDVPSNMALSATVTPVGNWNAIIGLLEGPANNCAMAGANCLAGDDPGGGAATANYTNNTNSTVTIYIIVGGIVAMDEGQYSIVATVM